MWGNIVETDRPQMTLWRMRNACCIPQATNTHSEYNVMLIASLKQQRLSEGASMLRYTYIVCKKVDSRNRPGVAQRVPVGLGSHISMTFGKWKWWGRQPHAPAAFTPRKGSWYSFSLGAESTPEPWYGREEYVTEESSDTMGNRSRDRPNSSTAP